VIFRPDFYKPKHYHFETLPDKIKIITEKALEYLTYYSDGSKYELDLTSQL
jgi:hypothetical protein